MHTKQVKYHTPVTPVEMAEAFKNTLLATGWVQTGNCGPADPSYCPSCFKAHRDVEVAKRCLADWEDRVTALGVGFKGWYEVARFTRHLIALVEMRDWLAVRFPKADAHA